MSADDRRLLEERARALAQPPAEAQALEEPLELLAFSRGGARYAVAAADVDEVVTQTAPTPLPLVPPAILGVVGHRGRVVALVDVARLLDPGTSPGAPASAVVVAAGDAVLALAADEIAGIVAVERGDVRAAAVGDARDGVVSGVTPALGAVLDVRALADDARIRVDEELE